MWAPHLVFDNPSRAEPGIKKTHYAIPGLIRAEVQWGTKTIDIGCVYAPAQPLQRVDFFNSLRGKLDSTTHVGGDWNCVPDVTLDVDSVNPLAYANRGATLLGDIVGNLALNDIRREQLGNAPEYTRKGPNSNGTWTSSRIDRWYTPTRDIGIGTDYCRHRASAGNP